MIQNLYKLIFLVPIELIDNQKYVQIDFSYFYWQEFLTKQLGPVTDIMGQFLRYFMQTVLTAYIKISETDP